MRHPDTWYRCIHCVRKFRISMYLESHIGSVHSKVCPQRNHPSMMARKCPVCEKWCTRPWVLKNHMKTHDESNRKKCEDCDKILLTEESYNRHKVEQITCNECMVIICYKRYIKKHMQTHSGEVTIQCNTCEKHFITKGELRKHVCSVPEDLQDLDGCIFM